jgi:hypothetical protein
VSSAEAVKLRLVSLQTATRSLGTLAAFACHSISTDTNSKCLNPALGLLQPTLRRCQSLSWCHCLLPAPHHPLPPLLAAWP